MQAIPNHEQRCIFYTLSYHHTEIAVLFGDLMNWITHLIPKKNWFGHKSTVPDHLWSRCTSCEKMIFHKLLEENLRVCPSCDFHMPISARLRLAHLFDPAPLQIENHASASEGHAGEEPRENQVHSEGHESLLKQD